MTFSRFSYAQVIGLTLGLAIALTVLRSPSSAKKQMSAKASDPVQLGLAVTKDVPIQIQGSGHVTPFATIAVKSHVDGELERALFNEGDELKRGSTLFPENHSHRFTSTRAHRYSLIPQC